VEGASKSTRTEERGLIYPEAAELEGRERQGCRKESEGGEERASFQRFAERKKESKSCGRLTGSGGGVEVFPKKTEEAGEARM